MEELNRDEIARIRERMHTYGNNLQELAAHHLRAEGKMDDIGEKLDAIHLSIKEDLGEIKGKQDQTNGRVTTLERRYAELRGIAIAFAAGSPFILFALQKLTS